MKNGMLQFLGALFVLPLTGMLNLSVIPLFWAYWLTFLIAAFVFAGMTSMHAWRVIRLPQVSMFWILLAGIVVLQWMLNMLHSNAAALTSMGYLIAAFLMTIAGHYYRHALGWKPLITTFSRAALLASLVASTVFLLSGPRFGVWLELNQVAGKVQSYGALSVAIGLSSWLYLVATQQLGKALSAISAILLLAGISRMMGVEGWWAISAIVVVAFIQQIIAIRTQSGSRQKRNWLRWALLAAVAYLVMRWVLPGNHVAVQPSLLDVWAAAFKIGLEHPWLGVGVGNVGWQSFVSISQPAVPGKVGVFYHAPNAFLQLWLEFGILGLLALLVAIITWLKSIKWSELNLEQLWTLSTVALILAVSMFSAPFHHVFYLMIFSLLLGVADEKHQAVRMPIAGAIGSGLTSAAIILALATAGIANARLIEAQKGSIKHPDTVARLQWAHSYSLLAPAAEEVFAQKLEDNQANALSKVWITSAAIRYQPTEQLAYRYVLLLELAGKHQEAVEFLKLALNAYPIKLNDMLAYFSPPHMQVFLNVLFEARPPKKASPQQQVNAVPF